MVRSRPQPTWQDAGPAGLSIASKIDFKTRILRVNNLTVPWVKGE
jgi:hypothetical protein